MSLISLMIITLVGCYSYEAVKGSLDKVKEPRPFEKAFLLKEDSSFYLRVINSGVVAFSFGSWKKSKDKILLEPVKPRPCGIIDFAKWDGVEDFGPFFQLYRKNWYRSLVGYTYILDGDTFIHQNSGGFTHKFSGIKELEIFDSITGFKCICDYGIPDSFNTAYIEMDENFLGYISHPSESWGGYTTEREFFIFNSMEYDTVSEKLFLGHPILGEVQIKPLGKIKFSRKSTPDRQARLFFKNKEAFPERKPIDSIRYELEAIYSPETDLYYDNPRIFVKSGGQVVKSVDSIFCKKYGIEYQFISVDSNRLKIIEAYNGVIFKHLSDRFGDVWLPNINNSSIGINELK